jgi:hypothetical protein
MEATDGQVFLKTAIKSVVKENGDAKALDQKIVAYIKDVKHSDSVSYEEKLSFLQENAVPPFRIASSYIPFGQEPSETKKVDYWFSLEHLLERPL